jgi:hypothetical protein
VHERLPLRTVPHIIPHELAFIRSGSRQYTSLLKDDNGVAYITVKIHGLACLEVVVKVVMVDDLASSDM